MSPRQASSNLDLQPKSTAKAADKSVHPTRKAEVRGPAPDTGSCHGTTVVLLSEYHSDLGGVGSCNYGDLMVLVLMMVVLAFGLLYVAVVAEERQMQEAAKPRKR